MCVLFIALEGGRGGLGLLDRDRGGVALTWGWTFRLLRLNCACVRTIQRRDAGPVVAPQH
jgi:hypothetical protein